MYFLFGQVLDSGGCLMSLPSRFTSGEGTQCPFYDRLIGPKDRSGPIRKISPPSGLDSRTDQHVASRYMD